MPVVEEPSKWEVIAGNYKVYDTLGAFLYDMNIVHVPNEVDEYVDSLRFENFDGEFMFTTKQSIWSSFPEYYITIGFHEPILDLTGNRWRVSSATDPTYNFLENDTIVLQFEKSNLQYYIQDLVPYFQCDCVQIAVKQ